MTQAWNNTKRQAFGAKKALRGAAYLGLTAILVLGVVAWRNPLWLVDRAVDTRMRLAGVQSEFVTVHGYKMHFLVGGNGSPLVLVHGLGSRGADWADTIPQFIAAGHRVYAIDLLGYGLSSQPKDAAYSIADQAAMVEGFLHSEHLQQVDLAGWSMGGWVAMRVALEQPRSIRRLVLLDSAGLRFKLGFDPALFQPASPEDLAALEQLLMPNPAPVPRFLAVAFLQRSANIGWLVHRSLQSMMGGNDLMDGKLGSLTMPVLIGWGDQDRLIPLTVGYKLHAEISQSVLDVYTNCGHLAPARCSKQVGPSVVNFLNAQPAPMAMIRTVPVVR